MVSTGFSPSGGSSADGLRAAVLRRAGWLGYPPYYPWSSNREVIGERGWADFAAGAGLPELRAALAYLHEVSRVRLKADVVRTKYGKIRGA